MILSDATIDRFSRQILLPEVGGRGQARLLAARVRVAGAGRAAEVAADLLGRSGVGTLGADVRPADVALAAGGRLPRDPGTPVVWARLAGAAGAVATLVGHPCPACAAADVAAPRAASGAPGNATPGRALDGLLADAAAQALGALAAAEVLGVLLGTVTAARVQRLDLAAGRWDGTRLAGPGCVQCGRGA